MQISSAFMCDNNPKNLFTLIQHRTLMSFVTFQLLSSRLKKEQLGTGKSQETLDSVVLQSSSERGPNEEETGEGNYPFEIQPDILRITKQEVPI